MEPVSSSSSPLSARPSAAATTVDLAAVLRDGRVVAGQVLQALGDGALLVGLGRHRVPAHTHLALEPGTSFLARVEHAAGQVLLHVLGGEGDAEPDWLRLLRGVVGDDRPVGELLADVAARVRAALSSGEGPPEALRRLLEALSGHALRPGAGGSELAARLGRSGLGYEAALLAAASGGLDAGGAAALAGDLKAALLRALGELPDGPAREAVARALAGLEAEQLLNGARREAGEPLVLSLPLAAAEGDEAWPTLRLLVPPRRDRGRDDGEDDGAGAPAEPETSRLVVGVRFPRTGPVRIDLLHGPGGLAARLVVTDPAVAARVRADLPALAERLGDGDRPARLAVGVGTPDEVAVGARPLDVAPLRDRRLMDVEG